MAAVGWPAGTIWHILPDDPLTRRDQRKRITNVDSLQWHEPDVPAGVGRPLMLIPIAIRKNVAAVLLGAHEDGTGLDPDEIRTIRRPCEDAALMYGREPAIEVDRAITDQPPIARVSEQPV